MLFDRAFSIIVSRKPTLNMGEGGGDLLVRYFSRFCIFKGFFLATLSIFYREQIYFMDAIVVFKLSNHVSYGLAV